MIENLRQSCIYISAYDKEDIKKALYWDYMKFFYNNCMKVKPPKFDDSCANEAMRQAKIDGVKIEKCIMQSFGISKY